MTGMLRPRVRRLFRLPLRRGAWTKEDVDAELRLHVELRVEQLVANGWTPEDAEAEARRRFGPSWDEAVRHLHRSGRAREEQLAMRERLELFRQDIRYAFRVLRRSPRFAAAAVLTLALGLGCTTLIFSLVDHIVLRPLPYAAPERLVVVRESDAAVRDAYPTLPANAGHFLEWKRKCTVCDGLAAIRHTQYTLTGEGDPQRVGAVRVSANLFSLLGVRTALGRGFRPEEEQSGRDRTAILSDEFWRREFGASPDVIGRSITLDGTQVEVVGVLPRGFSLPSGDALGALSGIPRPLDVYRPLALTERERMTGGEFDYVVLARLRPGATLEQAHAQIESVEADFSAREGRDGGYHASLTSMQDQVVGLAGRPLLLLLAAVGAVLLIVCVNLTNLSLARGSARAHESAVRAALGAGRARLARLALAESMIVAVIGGALGLLLARWGLATLVALAPATLPRIDEVRLDARVFTTAALLTALVGLIVGALPALRAGQSDPAEALKAGGRGATNGRRAASKRALFIAAQIAFSTVLLIGAGLFLTSFIRVLHVERGFDTERVLAIDVVVPGATYPTEARRNDFYERALAEVSAIPGVTSAAVASALPLEGETWVNGLRRADGGESVERTSANSRFVSPGYFRTIGTPIRAGRAFTADDRSHRVVLLSERAAHTLWPSESAIGKRVLAGGDGSSEVIGVVADVHTSSLEKEGSLVVYLPSWEYPPTPGVIVLRTSGEPSRVALAARAALRRVDPGVVLPNVRTMAEVVSAAVAARRFQLGLLALFALMALVTASVGIFGVISQSLASRTREIGVRMALGARPGDVQRLVLKEGLTPVAWGLVLGTLGSLALGRGVETLLYEVHPGDPVTLAAVCTLLGTVAVVACVVPAWRAATSDVSTLLRTE